MKTNKEFLLKKYNQADADYNSFDDDDVYFDDNDEDFVEDDYDDFDGEDDDLMASGGGKKKNINYSQPYIIKLDNTTGAAISNVEFLNAIESIGQTNDGVTLGITATYEYPNLTYASLLRKLQNEPFECALIRVSSDEATAIETVFEVETKNIRGKKMTDTIVPQINTFQQITTSLDVDAYFTVNDYTKITLASIPAGKYIQYTMYPSMVASSIATLKGRRPYKYKNPKISGMKMIGQRRAK